MSPGPSGASSPPGFGPAGFCVMSDLVAAKKVSGPSGKNTKPGILLRGDEAQLERWRAAAELEGVTVQDFLRAAADGRAAVVEAAHGRARRGLRGGRPRL